MSPRLVTRLYYLAGVTHLLIGLGWLLFLAPRWTAPIWTARAIGILALLTGAMCLVMAFGRSRQARTKEQAPR